MNNDVVVAEILQLYADYGSRAYGESVSQTEHAVQSALHAQQGGASDELVAATLLHDIGHFLDTVNHELAEFHHDRTGADYLARYFDPAVSEPVRLHAEAKRYLCTTEPDYHDGLSASSKFSLTKQGGLMTTEEVALFERQPYFQSALRLRRWDDRGKESSLKVGDISLFQPLLMRTCK